MDTTQSQVTVDQGSHSASTPIAVPRVLSVAGTDPTGGAGIQADLKSIAARGGYGMAVVTTLVAQNTCGVRSVHTPPIEFLEEQLNAVSDDVVIDAVKIGMLADVGIISAVQKWLDRIRPAVVVLDPVMIATSGDRLLQPAAEEALRAFVSSAGLVTPNLAELAVLAGTARALTWPDALEQGRLLSEQTKTTVLVKGGHLDGAQCPDAIVNSAADIIVQEVPGQRVLTRHTHGTGCSLSAAMATEQVRHQDWAASLAIVKPWLYGSLQHAEELKVGLGNGPIHHFHHLFP
ncbi:bifunctional hydroxymethylpyrimidine kinase/phosphomethylpyrimidine kinase [Arthrobacter roseus]|uniref:bifunctional hydroxymethylpyrimidine kinase/phosphomethylpyrimidine kinase n=1 Tax=Arthrobacter roseus TaxID=136274 RepID=UPI0030841D18|nr:hydroxymethylpyrimidine/phosphomethylpyrimidine kinase [Arthrobacter roseus]